MIAIYKFNNKQTSKPVDEHISAALTLFGLAALAGILLISCNGLSPVFAADKEFDIDVDIDEDPRVLDKA